MCHAGNDRTVFMRTTHSIIKRDCCQDSGTIRRHFAKDVLRGLSMSPKELPCKYLYDEKGSELFCRIMELPEYYLTKSEMEVLDTHKDRMQDLLGSTVFDLIELGAGDGLKTRTLIEHFINSDRDFHYCPIDISESAVADLVEGLNGDFYGLEIKGLVTDYFDGLRWLSARGGAKKLVLFLGSNIGNFSPHEALVFLRHLRRSIKFDDQLLIGFDLVKDIDVMLDAYNDAQGVTEAFNSNILVRINNELGGEFDLDRYSYIAKWDDRCSAIKSYQISTCGQEINIRGLNRTFTFKRDEPIHTESSYKFTLDRIESMASRSGFRVVEHFHDERRYFVDSLWEAI